MKKPVGSMYKPFWQHCSITQASASQLAVRSACLKATWMNSQTPRALGVFTPDALTKTVRCKFMKPAT